MRRIVCLLLCFGMLLSLCVFADGATFTPPDLSENTYTVSTASHLRWISAVCSGLVGAGTKNYPSNPNFEGYTIILKNKQVSLFIKKGQQCAIYLIYPIYFAAAEALRELRLTARTDPSLLIK